MDSMKCISEESSAVLLRSLPELKTSLIYGTYVLGFAIFDRKTVTLKIILVNGLES